jgi:hypothetical protein
VWAHIQKRRKYNRIWEQRYRFEQVQSLTKKKTYSRKKKTSRKDSCYPFYLNEHEWENIS